mmetsp:Transcript_9144/g.13711  ORF Transcript_9144/g.13711 Transcript_9144/m.13711 type:complete len:95 (+) Transcript_9144:1490-1774(+)
MVNNKNLPTNVTECPRKDNGFSPRHNNRCFDLDLTTEAGTYIKEFVHGDRGRTKPFLGDILDCRTDISQLDVMMLLSLHDDDKKKLMRAREEKT